MRELDFINDIKKIIGDEYIGDDCAHLKDLNIVITQDSLVENVHFKREWYTPSQLGYKSVIVNISDIIASGAKPAYITAALSLPKDLDDNFVSEFYKGASNALCGAKIVGGDITGSNSEIMISISAIGKTEYRKISSRKNAKPDYVIITKGEFGSSAKGLEDLYKGNLTSQFIKAHLEPSLEVEFGESISKNIKTDYAMMDSSDGLADALFKIAEASNVKIEANIEKVPHKNGITDEQILFGGEDYKLIAAVPKDFAKSIKNAVIIGEVFEYDGIRLDISGKKYNNYNELKVYNHFN